MTDIASLRSLYDVTGKITDHNTLLVNRGDFEALQALSVTKIMLDVVPGDGSGLEVYAKSVEDVENKLSDLDGRLEDWELGIKRHPILEERIKELEAQLTALEAPIALALRKAYQLGQTYWQQADSDSLIQNKKSDETRNKFVSLQAETVAMLKVTKQGE